MKKTEEAVPRWGIRSRIILYLLGFAAAVLVMLWLFQIVFLESFYRGYRIRQVSGFAERLAQHTDINLLRLDANELAPGLEICVMALDEQQRELVNVEGTRNCLIHKMSPTTLRGWCQQAKESDGPLTRMFSVSLLDVSGTLRSEFLPSGAVVLSTRTPDPFGGEPRETPRPEDAPREEHRERAALRMLGQHSDTSQTFIYAQQLTMADGTAVTLLLNTQITPVAATVSALTAQMWMITAAVVIGAILLALLISKRVSRPIIETNDAARELSHAAYTRPAHGDGYREIAELNTTLEHAAEELGQVERLQHELIANISHDLRTPLTMIGGYAEVMRDIPSENTPENMQIIIDETSRLSTLVNELLDFSRMQTGGTTLKPEVFDLTGTCESIIQRIGKLVSKDGYRVVFTPEERLSVYADETRIGQVIYNLIGNALTYTGEDKTVTVKQERRGDCAHIEIHDSGKGISPEELPKIWNRYYRTKETHRRAIIGSGLGLNIVQTILEQHNAQFGAISDVGKGTTFWFELKLAGEETDGQTAH